MLAHFNAEFFMARQLLIVIAGVVTVVIVACGSNNAIESAESTTQTAKVSPVPLFSQECDARVKEIMKQTYNQKVHALAKRLHEYEFTENITSADLISAKAFYERYVDRARTVCGTR
jgi:hypothetical protein